MFWCCSQLRACRRTTLHPRDTGLVIPRWQPQDNGDMRDGVSAVTTWLWAAAAAAPLGSARIQDLPGLWSPHLSKERILFSLLTCLNCHSHS